MAKTLDEAGVKRLIQEIKGANKNLNAPIPISTENTPESMAQNVKNIADYVEKAKAAGIADVNGMAVSCIIDDGFSGVGYLYGNTDIIVSGIITFDDGTEPYYFLIQSDGFYSENIILMGNSQNRVTSSMLTKGARKPIIITEDMTEVDEETYQKLLKGDTDVIADFGEGVFFESQAKFNTGDALVLMSGYSQFDENGNGVIATCTISINTSAPHTLTAISGSCDPVSKDTLSPVLQEIDLTGTDADRKAKLDQFETDWKALTGASDLTGSRFVGRFNINDYNSVGLFNYNQDLNYEGISCSDTLGDNICKVVFNPDDGSITITPLFSHLEAITIYTDNTPEHMQANLDNIAAYEANLQALGVTNVDGIMIPISFSDAETYVPFRGILTKNDALYNGIVPDVGESETGVRFIYIDSEGRVTFKNLAYESALNSKVDKSINAQSLEAITIKTGNTPDDEAANVAAIKAYVDNLKALGVDTTKGYMIPICFSDTELGYVMYHPSSTGSEYTGIVTGPGGSSSNIAIEKSGYAYVTTHIQPVESSSLTTTAKTIVPAINEVNALAKGYSTIFTPIELTTETAQNKTKIDARVAAFTAQGISLTNGCCIPVVYKGVYAGNISLINGDWYGLLVKNTNNPADNINIKLSADGTITEGNSVQ